MGENWMYHAVWGEIFMLLCSELSGLTYKYRCRHALCFSHSLVPAQTQPWVLSCTRCSKLKKEKKKRMETFINILATQIHTAADLEWMCRDSDIQLLQTESPVLDHCTITFYTFWVWTVYSQFSFQSQTHSLHAICFHVLFTWKNTRYWTIFRVSSQYFDVISCH